MAKRSAGLLCDTVAVVAGSSRGIGFAVAQGLAASGAAVVVNGRDAAAVETAVAALVAAGAVADGVVGSAADPAIAERLLAAGVSLGRVGVLVNCAGTAEQPGSSIVNVTSAQWHELLASHLHSTFETCRVFAPHLVAAGGGAIVNTASHAYTGRFGGTGYAAGKGAVISLTYALAAELAEHDVRVNAVCPGARTRLSTGADYTATIRELNRRKLLDDLSLAGALDPPPAEFVAPLYVYLASELAANISGRVLVAAGGYLGEFGAPTERLVAYRDHRDTAPYRPDEIATLVQGLRD
ncbi:SDR family NAD(P)-dependent oxidoreductase [Skermania piniformis]|uniref:SDR family oxidoreductase n=1 Tax=Skermania pinensis TaxID=39122 RepID=A0ABX8S686_9ACTN|nr:SDR family oxidoreductase [Skermania piniformis]QXQ12672.1 SDR family oxidoreductase [Skermania piniformis]